MMVLRIAGVGAGEHEDMFRQTGPVKAVAMVISYIRGTPLILLTS